MFKFLAGFLFAALLVPVIVFCYVKFGFVPAATDAAPMPFEMQLAHMGLNAHVDKEAPKDAPFQATTEDYLTAAHLYREHCSVCHGLPGEPQSASAQGMYPKPPKLMEGKGVTDDPAGESYWKVSNGIRLTGMPGYRKTLTPKEIWQISLLLANADKVAPEVTAALKKPMPADPR